MLPAASRLTTSRDFTEVVRNGRRTSARTVAVHLLATPEATGRARAGLVVSKAVGNAVVRHRVSRRLRHLLADRLAGLPEGSRLVVRAHPSSAGAPSSRLGSDLDVALGRALERARP